LQVVAAQLQFIGCPVGLHKKKKQRTDALQGVDGEFLFFLFQNDDWNKSHTKQNGAIGFGQKKDLDMIVLNFFWPNLWPIDKTVVICHS